MSHDCLTNNALEEGLPDEKANHQPTNAAVQSQDAKTNHFAHTKLATASSLGDTILLIAALCFHSVFEGIAIGVSETKEDAWKALWTISLHKIFAAIAMAIALLRMIPDRPLFSCATYAFAFAISSPIGVAIGIIIDQTAEGAVADWIFAISMGIACGVFVYVSINHLLAKGYCPHNKVGVDTPFFKFLNLKWCLRLTDYGISLVALRCPLLRSLDLSYVPITEKCLKPILQLPHLEELVLMACHGIDDDGLSSLHQAAHSLTTLDLSYCQKISHIGLSHLTRNAQLLHHIILSYGFAITVDLAKCLEKFSRIQCLKLDGCTVTCSALRTIGNWSASLKELSLSKCSGVTDEGISSLVKRHTQLTKLDITCCRKISSVSIHSITSSCTSLTSLKMEACALVSKQAFPLIGHHCPYLEELDVTDNDLDDQGLKSISRCSSLSILKLGICLNITDEGLIQVGMNCSRLKEIDLYRAMRITDVGIASVAQGCPTLELINIAYCDQVTDASLISLSKCSRLKALEMRGCPHITSVGLAAISAGCRQLTVLDIKKCFKIDNSGMIPLAHYSQNLRQINLSYCSITDVGLLALASISRLQNMTILHLAGLSPNGLAAALLACGGLRKVKLHSSFRALLPQSLLDHMESRGCVFHWRDKAFQPQVDADPLEWNLQIGRPPSPN